MPKKMWNKIKLRKCAHVSGKQLKGGRRVHRVFAVCVCAIKSEARRKAKQGKVKLGESLSQM